MTAVLNAPQHTTPIHNVNLLTARRDGFLVDPLNAMEGMWQTYGDVFVMKAPFITFTMISNPNYAREILINQKNTFLKPAASPYGDLLSDVLGVGLITNADYESWFVNRRMMQPMFHRRRLAAMAHKMTEAGDRMLTRWAQLPADAVVNISDEMMHATMDIVTQVMFSADISEQSATVGHAVSEALEIAFSRRAAIKAPLWLPTSTNQRYKRAIATLDKMIYGLIDNRRGQEAQYDDLLSMLLEARDEETGEGMSRRELRDEVTGIFGAGHETTSHTLSWTLYLLSQHPDIYHNLRDEIDGVLGKRTPTITDLQNLPYNRMVLEESMRMIPVIPLIPRYASEIVEIDGYEVPVSLTLTSVRNIHHHPEFWDEPKRFNPERMSAEAKKARHRLAWMPFGAGQRMCIGNNMALMEAQLLLAQIVQSYEFELVDDKVEAQLAVAVRPKNGMNMRIRPRN